MKPGKKRAHKQQLRPALAGEPRWLTPAIYLGLAGVIWLVFGQAVRFGFFNYDDSYYVYQNPWISDGLTKAGLVRAFNHSLVGNWHPLTSLSLMLDAQFFRLNASGYHAVNIILHTITVLLLFVAIRKMTGAVWRSAFVSALFAIHPLRVESVVWISERKDVLSGLFFMLGLITYARYARKPGLGSYLLVALTLTLGLLSKPMLVTFPFLLLLLDYWPLGRFAFSPPTGGDAGAVSSRVTRLLLEKIPLLALALAVCVATILSQTNALNAARDWPLRWRVDNAILTVWIYLGQMVWPVDLAVFYPHARSSLGLGVVIVSLFALVAVTIAFYLWRQKYPYLITGWLWYLGMLAPVIGLVQAGWQAHADRYTYLPQIGIYLAITWGVADFSAGWRWRNLILGSAAALAIAALMALAWRQVTCWSSSVRLWRHTIAVTTDNDVAQRGLGTALLSLGEVDEAIAHDREALRIRPHEANGLINLANALLQKKEYPEAIQLYRELLRARPNDNERHRNLGKALSASGATAEGMAEFREALRIQPNDSDAAYSLGNAFLEKGDPSSAIPYFQKAIAANAGNVAAHYNLAIALQREGRSEAAIMEFRETLRLDQRHIDAHNNLAITLLKAGEAATAIAEWQAAIRLQPDNAELHNNLAIAFLEQGHLSDTVREWRETLRLQPDKVGTQLSLAWVLATAPESTVRDARGALDLARQAFRASADRSLMAFRVLAAAFAESGQFSSAIQVAREGVQRAQTQSDSLMADLLQNDLALYEENIPRRDPTYGRGGEATP
jgi:tetratricopeptide (TPR) repeat protein